MMGIINSHHLSSSPGSFFYSNGWGTPGGPLGTSWCNGNPFHFQWVPIIFDFIYWVTTQEQGLWGTHVLGDPCIGRDTRHPFPFPTSEKHPVQMFIPFPYWGGHIPYLPGAPPFHFQRGSRSQSGSSRTQETHEKNKTFPQKHHHDQILASFLMSHLTALG